MVGRRRDPKAEQLAKTRTLNEHPETVADAQFASSEFFDAADLVQVKYEMVRRVEVEGSAVSAAAGSFGFSRQSYYTAASALAAGGLPGLVPAKPGPQRLQMVEDRFAEFVGAPRARLGRHQAGPAARPQTQ